MRNSLKRKLWHPISIWNKLKFRILGNWAEQTFSFWKSKQTFFFKKRVLIIRATAANGLIWSILGRSLIWSVVERLDTDKMHMMLILVISVVFLVKAKINISFFQPYWPSTNYNSADTRAWLANYSFHAHVDIFATRKIDIGHFCQLCVVEKITKVFGRNVIGVIQEEFFQVGQFC